MRIAPSERFSREAREPDQHHRSIWLLASPHCPDIQNRQNHSRLLKKALAADRRA